jgi:hypothetical protein
MDVLKTSVLYNRRRDCPTFFQRGKTMSAYRRFRFSLQAEFKRKVYRQVHALWADLDELKEVMDGTDRAVVLRRFYHRIYALKQAAYAVEAHEVRVVGESGMRKLGASRGHLAPLLRPFATLRLT